MILARAFPLAKFLESSTGSLPIHEKNTILDILVTWNLKFQTEIAAQNQYFQIITIPIPTVKSEVIPIPLKN